MARVPLDIVVRKTNGQARAGVSIYVYQRGTETPVEGFTTESGSTKVTYPLTTEVEGRIPHAWYQPGSYDIHCPEDAVNPTQPWEAIKGGENATASTLATEGIGVIIHGAEAGKSRGTLFSKYIWVGSVTPTNIGTDDLFVDTSAATIAINE